MIKNVIFDLDGTLVDSVAGIEFALKEAINWVLPGKSFQAKDLKRRLGPPINQIITKLLPNISDDTILKIDQQFRLIYDQDGWKKTRLFDSTIETLIGLSRKKVGMFVATNKPSIPTGQILALTGVTPFLADFISPDFNGKKTQDKSDLVYILIKKHGLRPYNTLMVGDTINDAQSAQSCGLDFAFAAYGYGNISDFGEYFLRYILNRPIDLLNQLVKG